jgi:hypothetical protein
MATRVFLHNPRNPGETLPSNARRPWGAVADPYGRSQRGFRGYRRGVGTTGQITLTQDQYNAMLLQGQQKEESTDWAGIIGGTTNALATAWNAYIQYETLKDAPKTTAPAPYPTAAPTGMTVGMQQAPAPSPTGTAPKKDNTMMMVGLGAAALIAMMAMRG